MAPKNCAEAGVLGVLPGIIGSIQAIETIKLLLGLGDPSSAACWPTTPSSRASREYKVRVDPTNEITYEPRPHRGRRARRPVHAPPVGRSRLIPDWPTPGSSRGTEDPANIRARTDAHDRSCG